MSATEDVGKLVAEAEALGQRIKTQRTGLRSLMSRAKSVVLHGHRLGLSDAYLARTLHIDRARTIPRWLKDET